MGDSDQHYRNYEASFQKTPEKPRRIATAVQAEEVAEEYCKAFFEKYGERPDLSDTVYITDLLAVVRTYGVPKAKQLVRGYLNVKNEWLAENAYPLQFFKKKINLCLAANPRIEVPRTYWIVNVLPCGTKVLSEDPAKLEGTPYHIKPKLYVVQ